jgi:DNA-binding protein YbaB
VAGVLLRTVPAMDGEQWLTSYQERLREFGARAAQAQKALAGLCATVTSRDGAVTVTVTPAGALQRLALSDRSEGMTRVQLAAAVLATARQAQGEAARQATEAVAPLVGDDAEAMRMLRSHLPVEDGAR